MTTLFRSVHVVVTAGVLSVGSVLGQGPERFRVISPACPGEGCAYGDWMACEEMELHVGPGLGDLIGERLDSGQVFQVVSGAVVVDSPKVVVVTRPTRQYRSTGSGVAFAVGDTLQVLYHRGEGFSAALSHADSLMTVEIFWPWPPYFNPRTGFAGEVAREGENSFWVEAENPAGARGWIPVEDVALARPSGITHRPLACRPR